MPAHYYVILFTVYDCEGEPSLNKIKQFGDRWLVFSGGNKPEKRCHESRILSLYDRTSDTSKPFAPFGSKIVDFEFMKTEKGMQLHVVIAYFSKLDVNACILFLVYNFYR